MQSSVVLRVVSVIWIPQRPLSVYNVIGYVITNNCKYSDIFNPALTTAGSACLPTPNTNLSRVLKVIPRLCFLIQKRTGACNPPNILGEQWTIRHATGKCTTVTRRLPSNEGRQRAGI